MNGRVIILGCGASTGVPLIGNRWGVCNPDNPKNRRTRSSLLLQTDSGKNVLIDTGPDLRAQLLDAHIEHLDSVIYTHAHADHIFGMDEVRQVYFIQKKEIQLFANASTLSTLKQCFPYLFTDTHPMYGGIFQVNEITSSFTTADIKFFPFFQEHSTMGSLGFRMGGFAYSTDFKTLDDNAISILQGVDTWIVEALRPEPHVAHAHLEQTLDLITKVNPRRAILTHMSCLLDYDDLKSKLPSHIEPAYDGMTLDVSFS